MDSRTGLRAGAGVPGQGQVCRRQRQVSSGQRVGSQRHGLCPRDGIGSPWARRRFPRSRGGCPRVGNGAEDETRRRGLCYRGGGRGPRPGQRSGSQGNGQMYPAVATGLEDGTAGRLTQLDGDQHGPTADRLVIGVRLTVGLSASVSLKPRVQPPPISCTLPTWFLAPGGVWSRRVCVGPACG